jgi:hypothetical protein
MLLLWAELLLLVAAVPFAANLTHFTWWGILVYMAGTLNAAGPQNPRLEQFALVTAVSITLLTLTLSSFRCTLFQTILDEMAPAAYLAGNFAAHYWPALRSVSRHTSGSPMHFDCTRLFLLYVTLVDPTVVYGCDLPRMLTTICGACLTIVVEVVVSWVV